MADHPLYRCNEVAALRALGRLRDSHPAAESITDQLEAAVYRMRVSEEVLVQHSRWCNTSGSWAAGFEPARSAARAMYGFIPDRLTDGGASTESSRCLLAGYVERLNRPPETNGSSSDARSPTAIEIASGVEFDRADVSITPHRPRPSSERTPGVAATFTCPSCFLIRPVSQFGPDGICVDCRS